MATQVRTCNMRYLRKQSGLSLRCLGELTGIHESTLSGYENNRRRPYLDYATKVAVALEVEVEAIWPEGVKDRPAAQTKFRKQGGELRKIRIAAGFGLPQDLAEATGLKLTVIRSYELGYSAPTLRHATTLNRVLGVDIASIYAPRNLRQSRQSPEKDTEGYRLRRAREAKGWKGCELAEQADISRSLLSHYELNRLVPPVKMRERLVKALGIEEAEVWPVSGVEQVSTNGSRQWQHPTEIKTPGNKVKKARIEQRISRSELSSQTGVSVPSITRWEEHDILPSRKAVGLILTKLGISSSYVFDFAPELLPRRSGVRIAEFRRLASKTLEEVAKACGVTRQRISALEKAEVLLNKPKLLPKIAVVLEVSEEELWGE